MEKKGPEKYSPKTLMTQALLCLAIVLLVCLVGVEVIRNVKQPKSYAENRTKQKKPLPLLGKQPQKIAVSKFKEKETLIKRYSSSVHNIEQELTEAQKKINLMDLTIETLANRLELQREEREKAETHYQEELRSLRLGAFEEQERLNKIVQEQKVENASTKLALNQKLQAISTYEEEVAEQNYLLDQQVVEIKSLINELEKQKMEIGGEADRLKEQLAIEQNRARELEEHLNDLSAQFNEAKILVDGSKDFQTALEQVEAKLGCKELELTAILGAFGENKNELSNQIQDLSYLLSWEKANSETLQTKLHSLVAQYEAEQTRAAKLEERLDEITAYAKETDSHITIQGILSSEKQEDLKTLCQLYEDSKLQTVELSLALDKEVQMRAEEEANAKVLAHVLNQIVDKTLTLEKELLTERESYAKQQDQLKELNLSLKAEKMRSEEVSEALQASFIELCLEKDRALEMETDLYSKQNALLALTAELKEQQKIFNETDEKLFTAHSQNQVDQQRIVDLEIQVESMQSKQEEMLADQILLQEHEKELRFSLDEQSVAKQILSEKLEKAQANRADSEKKIIELGAQILALEEGIEVMRYDLLAHQMQLFDKEEALAKATSDLNTFMAEESVRMKEMTDEMNMTYQRFSDEQNYSKELEIELNLAYDKANILEKTLSDFREEFQQNESDMELLTKVLNVSLSEQLEKNHLSFREELQQNESDMELLTNVLNDSLAEQLTTEQVKGRNLEEKLSLLEEQRNLWLSNNQKLTADLKRLAFEYQENKGQIQQLEDQLFSAKEVIDQKEEALQSQRDAITLTERDFGEKIAAKQQEMEKLTEALRKVSNKLEIADNENLTLSKQLDHEKGRLQKAAVALKKTLEEKGLKKNRQAEIEKQLRIALGRAQELEKDFQTKQLEFDLKGKEIQASADAIKVAYEEEKIRSMELADALQAATKLNNEELFRSIQLDSELKLALQKAKNFEEELCDVEALLLSREKEHEELTETLTNALRTEQEQLQTILTAFQQTVQDFESEKLRSEELGAELCSSYLQVDSLKNEVEMQQAHIAQREMDALKIEQLEEELLDLASRSNRLEVERLALEKELCNHKESLVIEENRIEDLQLELSSSKEENQQLQTELASMEKLKSALKESEEHLALLKEEKHLLSVSEAHLKEQLDELKQEFTTLSEDHSKLKEFATEQVESLKRSYVKKKTEFSEKTSELQNKLESTAEENEKLQTEVAKIQALENALKASEEQIALLNEENNLLSQTEVHLKNDLVNYQMQQGELTQELLTLADSHNQLSINQQAAQEKLEFLDQAVAEQKALLSYKSSEMQLLKNQLDIEMEAANEVRSMYEIAYQEQQKDKSQNSQLQETVAHLRKELECQGEEYAVTHESLLLEIEDLKNSLDREKITTSEISGELHKALTGFIEEQKNKQLLEKKLREISTLLSLQKQEQTAAALDD